MRTLSRADIENIKVGQTGLYEWGKDAPVVEAFPPREVVSGCRKGKLFRYVIVASPTGNATIGFCVHED